MRREGRRLNLNEVVLLTVLPLWRKLQTVGGKRCYRQGSYISLLKPRNEKRKQKLGERLKKSAERAKNVLIAEKDEKEKAEKDENEAEEQDDLMRNRALSILRTRAGEENAEISEEIAQAHPDPASMGMGNIKERNIKLAW